MAVLAGPGRAGSPSHFISLLLVQHGKILSICLSVCLYACLSVCLSVCLSLSLSHTHTHTHTHDNNNNNSSSNNNNNYYYYNLSVPSRNVADCNRVASFEICSQWPRLDVKMATRLPYCAKMRLSLRSYTKENF